MSARRVPMRLAAVVALVVMAAACEFPPEAVDDAAHEPAPPDPTTEADDGRGYEPEPPSPAPVEQQVGDTVGAYGVSAAHPQAVEVGMAVLADGGNAVDAAIATAYAVSVVEPFGSGIGGGGATLVYQQGEDPLAYDYREVVAHSGEIPASETGVPGFVAGMETLHTAHGTGDLADLLEPAIIFAEEGIEASDMLAGQLRASAGRLPVSEIPHFFPQGSALDPGAPLVQEELAQTLREIADEGTATFYEGQLAEELAAGVAGLDTTSLGDYEARVLEPATGEFGRYEIVSAAPPLTGATLVQTLQVAEATGVEDYPPDSADFVHAVAMAWRLAEQFRLEEVGDPDFVDVPAERLTDPQRNAALSEQITMDAVLEIDSGQPYGGLDTDTTHLTVVDAGGMVVSMTNTLSNLWGSGHYELGFFLNDQLRNFVEGGDSPNRPEPGKGTAASSTPTIVVDADGRPVLGLGSPGGPRIPHLLAQVLIRWALHGEELADAVAAPRFHLEGAVLQFEEPPSAEIVGDLLARGYADVSEPTFPYYFGSVQALEIDYEADELRGAADSRREGDYRVGAPNPR